jgi:energy-converting hydrogenase Eha subunit C
VSDLTSTSRGAKVLGLAALTDLLTGLVLSAVGLVSDRQPLALVGVLLLLSGGGMLCYVAWRRNQPESL